MVFPTRFREPVSPMPKTPEDTVRKIISPAKVFSRPRKASNSGVSTTSVRVVTVAAGSTLYSCPSTMARTMATRREESWPPFRRMLMGIWMQFSPFRQLQVGSRPRFCSRRLPQAPSSLWVGSKDGPP